MGRKGSFPLLLSLSLSVDKAIRSSVPEFLEAPARGSDEASALGRAGGGGSFTCMAPGKLQDVVFFPLGIFLHKSLGS